MLSFIVLVRDSRQYAEGCLRSLIASVSAAGLGGNVEYLLADDCSEPGSGIPEIFNAFRGAVKDPVRAMRFKTQQHYVRGVAYAMSIARGKHVVFFSHDMIVTPKCITTMLEVAEMASSAGVVRPASGHMDGSQFAQPSTFPIRAMHDAWSFARLMHRYWGTRSFTEATFTGDAMLIRRDVIDRIGVFDPRYFGFLGDIDYGLRMQNVGLDFVTARGAWLFHHGGGHIRDSKTAHRHTPAEMGRPLLHKAYELFRAKWDPALPASFDDFGAQHVLRLQKQPPKHGEIYQPPVTPSAEIVEML